MSRKKTPVPLARKHFDFYATTPEEGAARFAELTASPAVAGARVIAAVETNPSSEALMDIPSLVKVLDNQAKAVNNGDMALTEAMLMNQAVALQSLFTRLIERGMKADQQVHYDCQMRYALRAQSQCVRTLEVLAAIKNPPVVIARQANIANGPQQVNNCSEPSQVRNIESQQPKLLEELPSERMDTRTQGATIRRDPTLEAVGAVYRPEVPGGEG
jgi:hypothetical protein